MGTLREFIGKLWFGNKIAVITQDAFEKCNDIEDIRKAALMFGESWQLRSVVYDDVNKMKVMSYGVIGNVLVIEVA